MFSTSGLFEDGWPVGLATKGLAVMFGLALFGFIINSIYQLWFHPLAVFPGPPLLALSRLPTMWQANIKGNIVRNVAELHRKYGDIVRIGPNHLAVDGSIGWSQVYARRAERAEYTKDPNFFVKGPGFSIINSPIDIHRRQRRQLGHAFSDSALGEQEGIIMQYVELLMKRLSEHAEAGKPVNMVRWLNFMTFDVIGDLAFGDAFGSLQDSNYHPWVLGFFKAIRGGAANRFLNMYPQMKPFLTYKLEEIRHDKDSRNMAVEKANARIALGEQPHGTRRDFMTYMLRKTRDGEPGMSEAEIHMNAPLITVAGSETTATGLSGFFFYLGQNPKAYELLTKEIREGFSSEEDITLRSTSHLAYLNACLEETLRVYPPVPETPPRVSPGAEIENHFVPQGTIVTIFQWSTHHNPKNFLEPDSFRPQRWLPPTHPLHEAKYDSDNKGAFKPFSYGSRDCIGKNLAYAEMRVVISRILYLFDFELEPGQLDWQEKQNTFIVWEKGPLMAKLTLRKAAKEI